MSKIQQVTGGNGKAKSKIAHGRKGMPKKPPREIKSKFASDCYVCGVRIRAGIYVMYNGKSVWHKTCRYKTSGLKSSSEGNGW